MVNECHFCRGIVLTHERDHILLDEHADHQVAMHKRCATGHGVIENPDGSAGRPVEVTCPECGTVETL